MRFNFEIIEIIYSKIYLKLQLNSTSINVDALSFDQLRIEVKLYLFKCVLDEIKRFVMYELYYKSNLDSNFKSDKFFELILLRVKKLIEKRFFFLKKRKISISEINWAIKYLEIEDGKLCSFILDIICRNLSILQICSTYSFVNYKLITCLLENLIIKISNIFIYIIFVHRDVKSLLYIEFFSSNLTFLKAQKNSFYWQIYLTSTFLKPKYIYYNLYNIKVLNRYGISSKLIYIPILNSKEKDEFSTIQFLVLLYFQFIEFFYPRVLDIAYNLKSFNYLY